MRIGVALLIWARFAEPLALFHLHQGPGVILGLSLYAASVLLLVGYRSQLAAAWTGASLAGVIGYLGVARHDHSFVHHHCSLLMIVALLLALTPCGASLSVDRLLRVRAAERAGAPLPAERGPLWATWLICLQVSAVYFWGAVDKTYGAWLDGQRMEHIAMYFYTGSQRPTQPLFAPLMTAIAIGTVALEYYLAVGLWIRRWQRFTIPLAIAFHLLIYITVPVATFSLTMCLLFLLFLPPDDVHAAVDRVLGVAVSPRRSS